MRIHRRIPAFLIASALLSVWAITHAHADAAAPRKVCVLNFEAPENRVSRTIEKIFAGHPEISVKHLALPIDFANCIKDEATEILIIGHALITPQNKDGKHPVELAYFRNLVGDERKEAIEHVTSSFDEQIAQLEAAPQNGDDSSGDAEQITADKIKKLQSKKKKYATYPESKPYYVVRPFLPQAMAVARRTLAEQASQGQVKLKKIRLMSCVPQEVMAEYDDLRALIQENGIELDIAPTNGFMSMIEGIPVTSPSPKWLRKSL